MEEFVSEPIKLYRDGQTIETFSPSTSRAWQAIGWTLQPDAMPDAMPDSHDELPTDHAVVAVAFVEAAMVDESIGRKTTKRKP